MLSVGVVLGVASLRWAAGLPMHFPLEHANIAYALAHGSGYANPFGIATGPTAWVPPALPGVFAAEIWVGGHLGLDERILVVGVGFAAAFAAVALVIGRCLEGWRPLSRAVFAGAFAVYGILDPDFFVSTGPFMALACALLFSAAAAIRRSPASWGGYAGVALACGALSLLHPGLALGSLGVCIGAAGFALRRGSRAEARGVVLASVLGIALAVTPWAARNHAVFGQWIPAKSNGYFELVLSQEGNDDGLLTEAVLVAGHPSTNPRLLSEYQRLGERRFLEPYRSRALELVTSDPAHYLACCGARLRNALVLAVPQVDTEPVDVFVEPGLAARLVGRRLVLFCSGSAGLLWPPSQASVAQVRDALGDVTYTQREALVSDWTRAQAAIRAREASLPSLVRRFLWTGLPTVLCLVALAASRSWVPWPVGAAAAVYLVALIPNVLITHDLRHQTNFSLLFALFAAGAVEALGRRREVP